MNSQLVKESEVTATKNEVALPTLLPAKGDRVAAPVFVTKNYDQFTASYNNRALDEEKIRRIIEEIEAGYNYLSDQPISVVQSPAHPGVLVIIDGHNRHAVAQRLGVALFYKYAERMVTIEDASRANRNTKHWTQEDVLERFCKEGNPHYLALRNFWQQHPWFSLTTSARCCSTSNFRIDSFREGLYRADSVAFAERISSMALDFQPYFDRAVTDRFVGVLIQLGMNPNYNHKRMMEKIKYQSSKLVPCVSVSLYLDLMTHIYNYNARQGDEAIFRRHSGGRPTE